MYDRMSIEELYEYNPRYTLVKCDICNTRTPATKVYTMQRFQDDMEIIVCAHCMSDLKGKRGEKNDT